MPTDITPDPRVETVLEYFRRVDAGDPSLLELMTDDVQLYFPKFGVGYGKAAVADSARGLYSSLKRLAHDFNRMTILTSGNHVIVEGFESGVLQDGTTWPVPGLSEGRFCNVFEFAGCLIARVHIYVDPDFGSRHRNGFLWGEQARMSRGA